jgi:primosomal replication protein N
LTLTGLTNPSCNRLELVAAVDQCAPMRYTPAGIAALDLVLTHASEQPEAGGLRKVDLRLKAIAFGDQAERLARLALGTRLRCTGFLTNGRAGHGVVFHIQQFEPI